VLTGVALADVPKDRAAVLKEHGGQFIHVDPLPSASSDGRMRFDWPSILETLRRNGLTSVMVEGGGRIINTLLRPDAQDLIDSVIVTIAPTWLGQGGVVVSPERVRGEEGTPIPAGRLSHVKWHPFGDDVVLCGTFKP
jgi:2,5-diamino-6-(ribosylamino)-4(3H)-pyrimidinone 5'-phosphate reductase